ncbi:carboxylate-amine ligase [Streptomyces lancefieldiae]|uniref:Putative glutamate--cysteine ligase 2 n=1 Tax=Streptomyces lancefieldiae TaxID=3075520 RepID=A0ABU3AFY3_9ACTN|nr:glutamate--cysteine ligase [Streptomyces sp. DSM 40712]MDT0609085.1 glutamate--cysteine ligase [Streptomyces sp. DSM 40712]
MTNDSRSAPAPATADEGSLPTVGVEEEYFLVDPVTRLPVSGGPEVAAHAAGDIGDLVAEEFAQCQVEGRTPPCRTASELRRHLARVRRALVDAAGGEGLALCASGTPVLWGDGPAHVGDHPRYQAGRQQYRTMMDDFAISALHVHVHLPDRELAVLTVNHLRPWLPLLIALSANSPFHRARDTGYASWRSVIRSRFPCLGPPPYAASLEEHQRLAVVIADTEAMLEPDMPFWDLRPNPRLPTVEIRAMDVLQHVDDTVAVAVLLRSLVVTAAGKAQLGDPGPAWNSEVLRAACWRAARDGWSGSGFDALTGRVRPVAQLADQLVQHVRPVLEQYGDLQTVTTFVRHLARHGDGACRQRAWAGGGAGPAGAVDRLVRETARTPGFDDTISGA